MSGVRKRLVSVEVVIIPSLIQCPKYSSQNQFLFPFYLRYSVNNDCIGGWYDWHNAFNSADTSWSENENINKALSITKASLPFPRDDFGYQYMEYNRRRFGWLSTLLNSWQC